MERRGISSKHVYAEKGLAKALKLAIYELLPSLVSHSTAATKDMAIQAAGYDE